MPALMVKLVVVVDRKWHKAALALARPRPSTSVATQPGAQAWEEQRMDLDLVKAQQPATTTAADPLPLVKSTLQATCLCQLKTLWTRMCCLLRLCAHQAASS